MQNAFLIASKNYSEKQAGIMFFVFGMSQFLFQTPAGYLMDFSHKKTLLLGSAALGTTILTLITAAFAADGGDNLGFMIFIKFLQGGVTALIPPGLNSITQGIVGTVGMTSQVAKNEMMNHLGTAIIVLSGSLIAFFTYPNIGLLFIVSPIACLGTIYYLCQIKSGDIDHDAARGLEKTSKTDLRPDTPYFPPSLDNPNATSFVAPSTRSEQRETTPLELLKDPKLLVFIFICFTFHLSNGTVLPLVMQTLALENGRVGILMSGFCIIVAQVFMVMSASICGKYSVIHGRKTLFLIGISSVPLRCAILSFLLTFGQSSFRDVIILSTQILDGVGAGFFGTMYVLVTSDISGGTGRFSLTLGLTTAAMSIGGTVSGYLGQALAGDIGYQPAFVILGGMSLIPAFLYFFFMPETLSEKNKPLDEIAERGEEIY